MHGKGRYTWNDGLVYEVSTSTSAVVYILRPLSFISRANLKVAICVDKELTPGQTAGEFFKR